MKTRPLNTYRHMRRNAWRATNAWPWPEFNRTHVGANPYHIGSIARPRHAPAHVARSKYMPHIGAKERGRHA